MMDYQDDMSGDSLYAVEPINVAPITTTTPPPSTTATETYIVRKGDTLSQLAVDFDTTTAELVRINGLANPDVLYVGQEIRVPAGRGGSTPSSASASAPPAVQKGGTYTIQKGDTLSEIALAAGVSIDDLRQLNNLDGDMIRAGDKIDIPAGGKVPAEVKKTETKEPAPEADPAPEATELAVPEMAPAAAETAPEGTSPNSYVIEERIFYPGESLDDIAREYGVTKGDIMRLNGITDETQIKDGQTIRIPIAE
jgi:LysM repeat protein